MPTLIISYLLCIILVPKGFVIARLLIEHILLFRLGITTYEKIMEEREIEELDFKLKVRLKNLISIGRIIKFGIALIDKKGNETK